MSYKGTFMHEIRLVSGKSGCNMPRKPIRAVEYYFDKNFTCIP